MIIEVKVIPGAKKNLIKKEDKNFKIWLTASPERGKANKSLIKFLSSHFKIKKNQIKIIKGEKSRKKIIEISNLSLLFF